MIIGIKIQLAKQVFTFLLSRLDSAVRPFSHMYVCMYFTHLHLPNRSKTGEKKQYFCCLFILHLTSKKDLWLFKLRLQNSKKI